MVIFFVSFLVRFLLFFFFVFVDRFQLDEFVLFTDLVHKSFWTVWRKAKPKSKCCYVAAVGWPSDTFAYRYIYMNYAHTKCSVRLCGRRKGICGDEKIVERPMMMKKEKKTASEIYKINNGNNKFYACSRDVDGSICIWIGEWLRRNIHDECLAQWNGMTWWRRERSNRTESKIIHYTQTALDYECAIAMQVYSYLYRLAERTASSSTAPADGAEAAATVSSLDASFLVCTFPSEFTHTIFVFHSSQTLARVFWLHARTHTDAGRADYLRCECGAFWTHDVNGRQPSCDVCAVRRQWIQRHSEGESVRELMQWLDENERCLLREYARQTRSGTRARSRKYCCCWLLAAMIACRLPLCAYCVHLNCWIVENVRGSSAATRRTVALTIHQDAFASIQRRGPRFWWRVRRTFPPIIEKKIAIDATERHKHTCSERRYSVVVVRGGTRIAHSKYLSTNAQSSRYGRMTATIKNASFAFSTSFFPVVLSVGRSRVPSSLAPLHAKTHRVRVTSNAISIDHWDRVAFHFRSRWMEANARALTTTDADATAEKKKRKKKEQKCTGIETVCACAFFTFTFVYIVAVVLCLRSTASEHALR